MEKLPIINRELLNLTFPKIATHKQAEEYIASKVHLERSHFRSYEWDKPRHDPFLHQIATQRIYSRTEKFLEERREFARRERVKLNRQWHDLLEKEETLKDTFKKMTNFIISNEEKRQRARERRQEDYNLRMERTAEIEKLQQKFAETLESKAEMEQNISALKMFEDYLNQVVGESIDFKNADDLLRRYDALVSTRNELGKRQDATLRELEAARLKTARMAEENGFVILGLNNIVADLRGRYNTATRQALHWETVVYNIKDCMYEKIQEMNEVKQACWNTYLLMCKRKADQPKFEEEDYEKQLVYIKKTLQEVKTVKKLALGSSTRINSMKPRTKSISVAKVASTAKIHT